jgi:hypothetical protein
MCKTASIPSRADITDSQQSTIGVACKSQGDEGRQTGAAPDSRTIGPHINEAVASSQCRFAVLSEVRSFFCPPFRQRPNRGGRSVAGD